jgi:hypothetical protein
MIVLALLVAVPVFGKVKKTNIKNKKEVVRELPKKLPRLQEPVYLNTFGADHRFGPQTIRYLCSSVELQVQTYGQHQTCSNRQALVI